MQCDVQNSAHQAEMMAFNGFPMQISLKFWPSEAPTGHFILVPKSQWNTDFVWNIILFIRYSTTLLRLLARL